MMTQEQKLEEKAKKMELKHKKKLLKIEYQIKLKESGTALLWIWEFSKKLVVICSAIYIISFVYSCWVMVKFCDLSYLGTFISESSDILKTCVFGYFVKAGVENAVKIFTSKFFKTSTDEEDETLSESEGRG